MEETLTNTHNIIQTVTDIFPSAVIVGKLQIPPLTKIGKENMKKMRSEPEITLALLQLCEAYNLSFMFTVMGQLSLHQAF